MSTPHQFAAPPAALTGIWLLLAAAADPRISKIWLDRTPYSLRAALENSIDCRLMGCSHPGFVLPLGPQRSGKGHGRAAGLVDGPNELDATASSLSGRPFSIATFSATPLI